MLLPLIVTTLIAMTASATAAQVSSPICAIDMGSNTFRRIVGTFQEGRYTQIAIEQRTLGVGDDVTRNGRISDQKMAEIEKTLTDFKGACAREGATRMAAIGTAAFRDAPNGARVVALSKELGIAMEIATEERESTLAYLVGSLGQDNFAVVDNGSRSIELVAQENKALRHVVLPLGYRVAYEQFFATASDAAPAVRAFRERLQKEFANAPFMRGKQRLVGVEFGEMANGLFDKAAVEGRKFTLKELQQKLTEITGLGPAGFGALKKTPDIDRALPRLVTAVAVAETFGYSEFVLTERELGAGLIVEAGLNRLRPK